MQAKTDVERSIYDRKVDLAAYLPRFMTEYREMQALMQAEDREFSELLDALRNMLDDLFIQTASEAAVRRYEGIMGVRPAAGERLETRRLRLLLACARAKKCTIPALVAAAAVLGEAIEVEILPGHVIVIDFLSGNEANIAVLKKEFEASLPAHMEIVVRNVLKLGGGMHAGAAMGMNMRWVFREV